jgi:hypothetical protein
MPDQYRAAVHPSGSSRHTESSEPARIRVPADVERPDQVIAGLTARQAAILTVTAVVLWLLWQAVHAFVPPMVFMGCAAPVLATGTVLALGRRDGLSLDRYALAALRHARTGHRQVHAPEGVLPVPGFARTLTTSAVPPAPVPAQPVAQGIDAHGVIDLGRDGTSVIGAVGTVNFALRTPAEQEALIGAFAGWLNSLPGPVQILIRADRADLTPAITALRRDAPALPHPALEAAAGQHADFLSGLAATRDLLHRQVLLTHHHPAAGPAKPSTGGASGHPGPGGRSWLAIRAPRTSPRSRTTAVSGQGEASGRGLHRRAEDAARMLAGADVAVTALDGPTASALLAASCSPNNSASLPGGFSSPSAAAPAASISDEAGAGTVGFTPAWLHLGAQTVEVAGEHVATFAVTGYPSEVAPGWLEPVLTYPGRLDVALHIEPVPPVIAADRLRKQRARLESTRRLSDAKGRLQDPELDAAADDATDLAYAVARGQTRLFKVGIYLTVHAHSPSALADGVARVRALAESLLLRTEPATWRPLQGWATTLPLGVDALKLRRTLDTSALAAAFPFTSPDLPAADPVHPGRLSGVLYGVNATSPGLVVWDRWAQDNHNTVVLARSGAGKSYFTKLDVLRSLYTGVQVAVIDPENEYTALAADVGGTVLPLGRPGVRLNPLDIPQPLTPSAAAMGANVGDGLTRRVLFAHTFLDVALGGLDPGERAALDRAVMGAYQQVGITTDPRTWARPAPLLGDVATHLSATQDPGTVEAAHRLASRMAPFVTGSWSGLFNGPTSVRPDGHLVVFCLTDLPDELKTLATLLTLDAIWQKVSDPSVPAAARRRRLVVVDEAWLLMRDPAGASFLFRMAKAARKYATGLTVITQDAADLLGTDLGQAVVANAATQVLMRQAPQAIDVIAEAFGLSAGERQILLTAPQGRGLLLAGGSDRVAFQSIASPGEDALANSTPHSVTSHADPLSQAGISRASVLGDPDDPYAVAEEFA